MEITEQTRASMWVELIVKAATDQPAHRLFCFHYAGGNALVFKRWDLARLPGCEIHAICLPGRQQRMKEPLVTQMKPIVDAVADEISTSLPYSFFGHSMGATISFEVARELRRRALPGLSHLFASAAPAPHLRTNDVLRSQLSDQDLIAEMRTLGGTPEELYRYPELLQLMLPVLRADFAVLDNYQYQEEDPLPAPISVLIGTKDDQVDAEEALGWQQQTSSRFQVHRIEGDHFFMQSQASEVQAIIEKQLLGDNPA